MCCVKHKRPELNNQSLHGGLTSHHCQENPVLVYSTQHIAFPVEFACINLIEQLHEDKCIEHDGKVFSWSGVDTSASTILYVKEFVPHEHKDEHNYELVGGVSNYEEPHAARYEGLGLPIWLSFQKIF